MILGHTLFRAAQINGAGEALVCSGRRFVWEETLERVRKGASLLAAAGAGPGQRVAILAPNCAEYVELTYAAALAGATMVPMNTRLAERELVALLRQARPSVLCFGADFDGAAQTIRDGVPGIETWLRIGGDGETAPGWAIDYNTALAGERPAEPVRLDREADWAIIFTGGTTGLPKGVRLSHRALTNNLSSILADMNWGEAPRFLQTTPLFHLAGLGPSYAVTAMGGCQIILPAFTVEAFLESMAGEKCAATALVPTMVNWVLNHPELDRHDLSAWRHMGYGASPIAATVLTRLLDRFPQLSLTQFYGQTEACGGLTTLKAADHANRHRPDRFASAGRPTYNTHVRIVDAETAEPCPRGVAGEIIAQTEGLFSGYLGHDDLTAQTVRKGWLHTGDVGWMDEDGYVYVIDRVKDMIVTGAENVSSTEVESVLLKHPAVAEAAIIGLPDADWGERVHAVIIPRPGHGVDEEALKAHCREHIAGYKCPKSISVRTGQMPLSAMGKVRKDLLRDEYRHLVPEEKIHD